MELTVLVGSYRGVRYAFDVERVAAIAWLPALAPAHELPPWIVGVCDVRGRVVPVMDLGLRFGLPAEPLRPDQRLLVLEDGAARLGVIVDVVLELAAVPGDALADAASYEDAGGAARFVAGQVRLGHGLVMRLDVGALLRAAPVDPEVVPGAALALAGLSPEAEARLLDRARELARPPDPPRPAAEIPLVLVRLGGELLALPAAHVRELAHLGAVTPLPCTPPHVLGNVSLRGDVLTVVDLRGVLGLAADRPAPDLVVIEVAPREFGVIVEEVVAVVTVDEAAIGAPPVASRGADRPACAGVVPVDGAPACLLDVPAVLALPALDLGGGRA